MADVTTPKEETLIEKLDDEAKALWSEFKQLWSDDVWPFVTDFFSLLFGQVEKAEFAQVLAIVADFVAGNIAAAVADITGVAVETVKANAADDVKQALASVGVDAAGNPIAAPVADTTIDPDGVTTVQSTNPAA